MAKKSLSPYCFKTLLKTKINGTKIQLRAYQTRKGLIDATTGAEIPVNIFFYEINASDGGYKKVYDLATAHATYEKMIEFEKRQLIIGKD